MAEPWNDDLTEDWVPQPEEESDDDDGVSEPETPGDDEDNETLSRIALHSNQLPQESELPPQKVSTGADGPRKVSFSTQEFTEWTTQVMDKLRAEQQSQTGTSADSSKDVSRLSTVEEAETESEHKLDSKRRISPQDISHLLSKQVAGMVLDSEKHTWVPVNGGQDSDPLAGISDLSVDESMERGRIVETIQANQDDIDSSSLPSKWSKFASSGPVPTTRATSWGDAPVELSKRVEAPARSIRVTVSTPLNVRNTSILQSSILRRSHVSFNLTPIKAVSSTESSPAQDGPTFHLSTLPDFTVNETENVHREAPKVPAIQSNPSLATLLLVAALTDIEPYEPFWEQMEQLDLQARKLDSLECMDQFCSRLRELDVSGNQLSHVNGIPGQYLRRLFIANNRLTDLTAWTRLSNLHFIDISGNQLESLDGFQGLLHLSHLVADDNKIESLEGIVYSRSLVKLSVQRNCIGLVDFEENKLDLLEELDLRSNQIKQCLNLDGLRSLTSLNLDDNHLESLVFSKAVDKMQSLSLNRNKLSQIDISLLPSLRVLNVDSNAVTHIEGLLAANHVDILSLRSQHTSSSRCIIPLDDAFEIRKLFISNNHIPSLNLSRTFLNLQTLELAAVGLRSLPSDFGSKFPNLRVLTLQDNCISDIRPLSGSGSGQDGVPLYLKRLNLSGNRLADTRAIFKALAPFKNLTQLDLRNNPATIGFYPTASERCIGEKENDDHATQRKGREAFQARQDVESRVRMRVYEIMLWRSSKALKLLDGMEFGKSHALRRDDIYKRLVDLEFLVPAA